MQESSNEIARRVLTQVLERLDASSSPALNNASQSPAGGEPVVIVVLGQTNWRPAMSEDSQPTLKEPLTQAAAENTVTGSLHPGLEKFELPTTSPNARAPKSCFMEPDRRCVNSGVCEMRGY